MDLYKRHRELVLKKFSGGLTDEELNELLEIRKKLDELDEPLIKNMEKVYKQLIVKNMEKVYKQLIGR